MLADRLLALIAALSLLTFFGVVLWFVPQIDLAIVIVFVMILMLYDFWRDLGPQKSEDAHTND